MHNYFFRDFISEAQGINGLPAEADGFSHGKPDVGACGQSVSTDAFFQKSKNPVNENNGICLREEYRQGIVG